MRVMQEVKVELLVTMVVAVAAEIVMHAAMMAVAVVAGHLMRIQRMQLESPTQRDTNLDLVMLH